MVKQFETALFKLILSRYNLLIFFKTTIKEVFFPKDMLTKSSLVLNVINSTYYICFCFWTRDGLDSKFSHNNSCDWVWGFVLGMGHSSARMGGWSYCDVLVLFCDILYFHTPLRLLSFRGPSLWQKKLHLYGRSSIQPWYIIFTMFWFSTQII